MLKSRIIPMITTLALGSPEIGFAGVLPLAEAERVIKSPVYDNSQQTLLLDQLDMVFSKLYVNRDLKIKVFGQAQDPLVKIERLKSQVGELAPLEFSLGVEGLFTGLHDLHTSYKPPKPLSCATAFIPIFFDSVTEQARQVVLVAGRAAIGSRGTEAIKIGDELVKFDGIPVATVLEGLDDVSGGANPDAMRVRALELLSMRSFGSPQKPLKSTATLDLIGASGPYQVDAPWQALVDDECLAGTATRTSLPVAAGSTESTDRLSSGKTRVHTVGLVTPRRPRLDLAINPFQETFNKIYGQKGLVENLLEDEQAFDKIFTMQTIKTPAGKLGYIQLKSFFWDDLSLEVGVVTDAFKRELIRRFGDQNPANSLAPVSGLIIDVRGNPGGIILFAEKIVQLFTPQGVEPTTVQMLANDLNRQLFINANGASNRWSDGIQNAMDLGRVYTKPEAITPKSEANKIGQVWFKPVVVLTDARCYSACDLFAAGMQDNGAGKVIGIHSTTGAGGANVMEYSTFKTIMAGSGYQPFVDLPYGQDFGISWRQTIRSGKNAGELLETYGVVSDVIVPMTKSDLGRESRSLMSKIHEQLDLMAPDWQSGVKDQHPGSRVNLGNLEGATWQEMVWGVDEITVLKNELPLASFPVTLDEQSQATVTLDIPELTGAWRDQPLVLIGKKAGQQVFRVVRELSWRGDYWKIPEQGFAISFDSQDVNPLKIETLQGTEGWQVTDGVLRIGRGPNYGSRVFSRAFLPLELNGQGAVLTLDLGLEAEEINDSLRIYLLDPASGERFDVFAGSSLPKQRGVRVSIPGAPERNRMEVIFEFESDENWNLSGPMIDNLKVTRKSL